MRPDFEKHIGVHDVMITVVRKWTQQAEFKFWMKQLTLYFVLKSFGNVWIYLFFSPAIGKIVGQTAFSSFGKATRLEERKALN